MNKLKTNTQLPQAIVSKSVILPNELRVGNFVFADLYDETKILVESICSITQDVFNSTTGEIPFTSLKPIPINEDLLCKLGFNKTGGTYELCDGLIELVYAKDGMYEVIEGQWKSLKHIKHLHQLQNLYFALTGRELTVC